MPEPISGELLNMRTRLQRIIRGLIHETQAAEIAEAAAVLPIMFMILLGIFWFGQAFSLYGAITRAAQEGARAGAAPYCTTCSSAGPRPSQLAATAVQNALQASKLDPTQAQFPTTPQSFNSCIVNGSPPGCDGSASNKVCIQTPVQLTSTVQSGAAGVCGISVSFQYPFNFHLPFVTQPHQQIWLQASARVRMETR